MWVIDDNAVTHDLKSQQGWSVVKDDNIDCILMENVNELVIEMHQPLLVFRLRNLIGQQNGDVDIRLTVCGACCLRSEKVSQDDVARVKERFQLRFVSVNIHGSIP